MRINCMKMRCAGWIQPITGKTESMCPITQPYRNPGVRPKLQPYMTDAIRIPVGTGTTKYMYIYSCSWTTRSRSS
jgi:hypothetical protein